MFRKEKKLDALFDELVPSSGKSDSVAGELVRAVCRIYYRYFKDGDRIGIGYGNTTCNAPARYLERRGVDMVRKVIKALRNSYDDTAYETRLYMLTDEVIDFINLHPSLRTLETPDMWSFYDEKEDSYEAYEEE